MLSKNETFAPNTELEVAKILEMQKLIEHAYLGYPTERQK